MAEILTLTATVQGQARFSWPSFAIGETVNINLTCIDPSVGGPLNLAGAAVIWTMADRFSGAVKISRQATVTNSAQGLATVPIASGDTVVGGVPLPWGDYNVDCWAEDASGNRLDLAYGPIFIGPAYRLPNAPVNPLPSQTPIPAGYVTIQNPSGAAVTQRSVVEFTGSGVSSISDDSANGRTVVTISGGGGSLPSGSAFQFLELQGDGVTPAWVTLTQDMISPAFTVSLSGPSTPVEVGATITNPQFTDSHNQTPVTASLQDNTDTQSIIPATLTALGYGGAANTFPARSYQVTSVNGTRTWTYSATNSGGVTKTANYTVTWEARVYFDVATPGTYNAAFITALTGSALATGFARTIAFGAGGGTKNLYYAFPTSFGAPTTFKDTQTGFGVPFSKVASSVSVTNANGVAINYDLWASDNALINAVTVQVS